MTDEQQVVKDTNKLRVTALAWLGRQEYSIDKFSRKLEQYGATAEQVSLIVEEFCNANWLSETRYCQGFVRARIRKGQGRIRIINDARGHGLDKDILLAALTQAEDEDGVDWFELALETYRRRYGQTTIADMKEKAKRLRFMQYRGFTMEQIQYAIDEANDDSREYF